MSSSRKRSKTRKFSLGKKLLLAFLLIILAAASTAGYIVYALNRSAGEGSKQEVIIEAGETVRQIASKLKEKGLICSANLFIGYVTLKGMAPQIEAGHYEIPPSLSLVQIIEVLRHGTFDIKLTFLEGWRREEYAEYVVKKLPVDSDSFKKEFMSATKGKEGYLFPDTYLVSQNISAEELVAVLTETFNEKYGEVEEAAKSRGIKKKQVVILASLVEREARDAKDAPTIAGILWKRFNLGWTLDVDAAVQYAVGYQKEEGSWWKEGLTAKDLAIKSPYNTRRVQGLPPTPICNPGLDALKAAANPLTSNYLYYLHDKDGGIHYAKTLTEHNQNVVEYLK